MEDKKDVSSQDVTKDVSKAAPEFTDISDEAWRMYDFPDMSVIITAPVKLSVKRKLNGDSHRIIDAEGVSHYVPAGWRKLSWKGKNGEAYSF